MYRLCVRIHHYFYTYFCIRDRHICYSMVISGFYQLNERNETATLDIKIIICLKNIVYSSNTYLNLMCVHNRYCHRTGKRLVFIYVQIPFGFIIGHRRSTLLCWKMLLCIYRENTENFFYIYMHTYSNLFIVVLITHIYKAIYLCDQVKPYVCFEIYSFSNITYHTHTHTHWVGSYISIYIYIFIYSIHIWYSNINIL